MSQFFGQQLLTAQYFRPQYLHGQEVTTTGRSGYWRLFYYQLQEEELKKHEQEQGQKAEEGKSESPRKVTAVVSQPAKPKASVVIAEREPLKVHPKPIYQRPPEPVTIAPRLRVLSTEFQAWNTSSRALEKLIRDKAANDEDEAIILLLMAA